jgi:hypothetical protein
LNLGQAEQLQQPDTQPMSNRTIALNFAECGSAWWLLCSLAT